VVLNEALKDEVKITVIATGFQRDNLPQLARRGSVAEAMMPAPAPPAPVETMEPLFQDLMPTPTAPQVEEEPVPVAVDDIEVPAYLRRERRLYQ
jgi:cell division protein FtsZ